MKKINKTILFLALTLFISYAVAGLFYFLGGYNFKYGGILLATFYMFIPAICVLIVERIIHREDIIQNTYISFKLNKWFLVAWLVPPLLAIVTFFISLLFPGVSYSPGMEGMAERFSDVLSPEQIEEMQNSLETMPLNPFIIILLQGLIAGFTVNALAGFGEELGWRGFLVKQFRNMNFMKAAIITGFFWGIWHAPLILMGHNYPQHPQMGVLMMTIWTILLSPLFLYVTIKAKSVIAAAIMHGTLNGTAGLSIMIIRGGNDLTVGASGLAGFISLILIIAGFYWYDAYISKEKIMQREIGDLWDSDKYQLQ
jgi:uncharacterized protein